jgi:putative ABC transport system permease protein
MSGPIDLGPGQLAFAALLILLNAAISFRLQLGLGRRLMLAAVRTVVQLSLLGLLLQWVFSVQGPWAVLPLMIAMALIAGFEAVRRTTRRVSGIYPSSIGIVLVTSMAVTLYGLVVVIGTEPWYAPRYAVPILGMVLGNTLSGISLGMETALRGFDRDRRDVELLLAHGATRREAARDVVRNAVRTGMIPILNAMVAAGLISIPGMMTGQILAGQDPAAAARYQVFIMFAIAGGTALGTIGAVVAVSRLVFDERERLRADRIRPA